MALDPLQQLGTVLHDEFREKVTPLDALDVLPFVVGQGDQRKHQRLDLHCEARKIRSLAASEYGSQRLLEFGLAEGRAMRDRVVRDRTIQYAAKRDEERMEKRRVVSRPALQGEPVSQEGVPADLIQQAFQPEDLLKGVQAEGRLSSQAIEVLAAKHLPRCRWRSPSVPERRGSTGGRAGHRAGADRGRRWMQDAWARDAPGTSRRRTAARPVAPGRSRGSQTSVARRVGRGRPPGPPGAGPPSPCRFP